jgi:hypothetical protein
VEDEIRDACRLRERADIKAAETSAREALNRAVADYNKARSEFMEKLGKTRDYAQFFAWGAAGTLVEAEYKGTLAARVLNLAETQTERHLFDWLAIALRHEVKDAVAMRHEGAQCFWRQASKFSVAEGRRDVLDSCGGISWVLHTGQACIRARRELGLEPPPWTEVDTSYIRTDFPIPALETPK